MQDKGIYNIQGLEFKLVPNDLNLLNKAVPLIVRLRKLSFENTKDIDLSAKKKYDDRIADLTDAIAQLEKNVETGKEADGRVLTAEQVEHKKTRITELGKSLAIEIDEFAGNAPLQNLLALKAELEGYALIEMLTDIDFIVQGLSTDIETGKKTRTWSGLKSILVGDISRIDWTKPEVIGFVKAVVEDFFNAMNSSSLKL